MVPSDPLPAKKTDSAAAMLLPYGSACAFKRRDPVSLQTQIGVLSHSARSHAVIAPAQHRGKETPVVENSQANLAPYEAKNVRSCSPEF